MLTINYLAVIVAAVVNMIIGFLWYNQFFGKSWMKAAGITQKDVELAKKKGVFGTYAVSFLTALVLSFFTAILMDIMSARTVVSGALAGGMIWLGFVATTHLSHYLSEGRSLELYKINVTYHLAQLMLTGAILAAWR